ncbi:MAG: COG4705 family protein [Rhizobiaceae bacterium]
MNSTAKEYLSKVPEVVLTFWIIKIAATTLGETGGDAVTMTWLHADKNAHNGGYLIGTLIFAAVFIAAVAIQIMLKKFNPWAYWAAIVASTTVGTALADMVDRSLGIGYPGGVAILISCVLLSLALWYMALGSIDVRTVATPKVEIFYWVTITFSQTLGTALGDWMADSAGTGYAGGALIFAAGLAILAALYYWTSISRVFLFWAAFILTRPLGATVGDFLDKPFNHGGLDLSRPLASAIIAAFIIACVLILPQRAGEHPGSGHAEPAGAE